MFTFNIIEPQMLNMDSPYFGAAIEGSRIQAVKMHSTITLTCRVEINENHIKQFTKQESNNNNARRIEWLKDGKIINFEVSTTSKSLQKKGGEEICKFH